MKIADVCTGFQSFCWAAFSWRGSSVVTVGCSVCGCQTLTSNFTRPDCGVTGQSTYWPLCISSSVTPAYYWRPLSPSPQRSAGVFRQSLMPDCMSLDTTAISTPTRPGTFGASLIIEFARSATHFSVYSLAVINCSFAGIRSRRFASEFEEKFSTVKQLYDDAWILEIGLLFATLPRIAASLLANQFVLRVKRFGIVVDN